MREAECNTPDVTGEAWETRLKRVPDPRKRRGQRYAWGTLLLVICAALMSGQQTGAAIAQWVSGACARSGRRGRPPTRGACPARRRCGGRCGWWIRSSWKTPWGPGWEARLRVAERTLETLPDGALRAVAVDGKAVRGAQTHGAKVHLVSLVTHAQALTLAQCAVEAKSNEIPAVQRFLEGADLRGWVVTLDAMHTQRETAELILRQGGHYLMMVKENQPDALRRPARSGSPDPASGLRSASVGSCDERQKAHGRLAKRRALRRRRLIRCGQLDLARLSWRPPRACARVIWACELLARGRERRRR